MQKDIVIEVNKLLFKFIWEGKDKRLSLISDLDKGGLQAPYLESIIKEKGLCVERNLPRISKVIGRLSFPIIYEERRIEIDFALRI